MRYMFSSAGRFNQDISSWDVSSVNDALGMFYGASRFGQNLCSWNDKIPKSAGVSLMFQSTNCPATDDPDLFSNPPGPFCHFCN